MTKQTNTHEPGPDFEHDAHDDILALIEEEQSDD